MVRMSILRVSCVLLLGSLSLAPLAAQRAEARMTLSAQEVFKAFTSVPEKELPAALLRHAWAIAILPDVKKAGFIIGGQAGRGVLVAKARDGTWSRPLFLTLAGGSVGFQAGIQSADILLFFRTRDSVERVLRGKYTLGVGASLAAGSLGRDAAAVTDQDLKAEIYSYARTRGLFAGLALQGTSLDVDFDANSDYYGKEITSAQEVLSGAGLADPPSAVELRQEITRALEKVR
jgi:lipid-binding SYLF domain-containing protein